MPKGNKQPEGDNEVKITDEPVDKVEPAENPDEEKPLNQQMAEANQRAAEQEEKAGMQAEAADSNDLPWQVIQAQEFLPAGEKTRAYFEFNGEYVLVCEGGFYGNHKGQVQKLHPKVLIDNAA